MTYKSRLFAITLFFSFQSILAQDLSGPWYGMLDLPDFELRINLTVTETDSVYTGSIDLPDLEVSGIPVPGMQLNETSLSFKVGGGNSFSGDVYPNCQGVSGIWKNNDGSFPFTLGRDSLAPPARSMVTIRESYEKKEQYITMRDGVRLFCSIYSPRNSSEAQPILMVRTPYNSEPREEGYTQQLLFLDHLIRSGYIFVFQDVRGRYMSEGSFEDVRPYNPKKKRKEIDENSDTYDTVEWLVKNVPNNNGKVGIFGVSYPGFYSTMALPEAQPANKSVSPPAPVSDWFMGDDWHHNGAFFLMDAFNFYSSIIQRRTEPTREDPPGFEYKNTDNYDFYMDLGTVKEAKQRYLGDSTQFWNQLMEHATYDDFWKARNPLPHLTNLEPAVMTVGGWFDAEDLYGPLHTYKAIETQNPATLSNRLVMGPWFHGQWQTKTADKMGNIHFDSNTADFYRKLELQFFNYYLKGQGAMELPEASIFVTGANEWKQFSSWPPKNTETRNLYLQAQGQLAFVPPAVSASFDEYLADPDKPVPYTEDVHMQRTREYLTDDQRFASRRPDVAVYETPPLEEDLTLVGPMQVDFYVSTTGTDADYVVKLIDVFLDEVSDYPDNEKQVPMGGYQMLVRGEVLRGKFRNSFEQPEPFVPGEVTRVRFEIPDLAHTFKKGHKLMVQVQNSWFPLVDRNPQQFLNIYEAGEGDFIKATHRIYHDAERPSSVEVRVLKEE
jgi:putative CocE/NonD family hydrolase